MPLSRAQLTQELVPGLHAIIGLSYDDYKSEWKEIFEQTTSKRSFEIELKLVGFGRNALKPEGEQLEFDDQAGEAWQAKYIMQTYALGFILTEEAVEDNLYDSLGERYSKQLGRSMAKSKDYNTINVLNLAFSSSFPGGDSVSLCNAAHPTFSGVTNSNLAATGTDLNEATLENAVIQVEQWVDERNMLIACKARKLVIPTGLQFIAKRLLASPYRPGTGDNDINAMKDMDSIPEGYTVNHYLTDPDAWFIKTDVPDGFKLFQRVPLQKEKIGDFNTGNLRFKCRERYSFGYTDPLCVYGSQGAS